MVFGKTINIETNGFSDIKNITGITFDLVKESKIKNGLANISVIGSTASVSTIEFEPALVEDIRDSLEKLAPSEQRTRHGDTWGDDNGFSHIRSTLMGPGITLPVVDGEILIGTWQQIVVIDHDNRARARKVRIQILGD